MPNWNARVEQELRSLDRLLSVTLTIESRFASAEWDLRAAVILRRIRRLYFREDGALGFLRRLAEGEPISEAERLRLRAQHDSFEAEMEDAAEALRVTARRNDIRIDMDAMALLEGLVNDSTTIRDTVHGMFDAPVGALVDTEASRRDARFILDALEPRLNRFREADIRLRMRARAHGVDLPGAETSPETTPETEAEEEAREAAEARAAFIGAPAPSPAADVADALSVRSGAPGRGLAETLRRMTARAEAEGRGAAAARGPDHGTDRRTHRGAEDWPEHRAEHGAERGGQGVDPNQRELDLDHPPRRASRAETARRRWATRRLPRAEGAGRDPVDLIPGAPGAPDGPGAGVRRVAERGAAKRDRSAEDPSPEDGRVEAGAQRMAAGVDPAGSARSIARPAPRAGAATLPASGPASVSGPVTGPVTGRQPVSPHGGPAHPAPDARRRPPPAAERERRPTDARPSPGSAAGAAASTDARTTPPPVRAATPKPEPARDPSPPPTPPKRRWFGLRRLLGLEDPAEPVPARREPAAPLRSP